VLRLRRSADSLAAAAGRIQRHGSNGVLQHKTIQVRNSTIRATFLARLLPALKRFHFGRIFSVWAEGQGKIFTHGQRKMPYMPSQYTVIPTAFYTDASGVLLIKHVQG
jgi:hypothetical protein